MNSYSSNEFNVIAKESLQSYLRNYEFTRSPQSNEFLGEIVRRRLSSIILHLYSDIIKGSSPTWNLETQRRRLTKK